MRTPDRRALLDRGHSRLSVRWQCVLLHIARSGVYRPLKPANDNDLALMRRIDELFMAWPFLGSRRMAAMLRAESFAINRKRVQRLMRQMGIAALGPKPRTTKPAPRHMNRTGFPGGHWVWVRPPSAARSAVHSIALRLRPVGCCRWARAAAGC